MHIALLTFGTAFTAASIWLAVRIVNRRECWAKWTAAGLVTALAYPVSFGPACWLSSYYASDDGAFVTAAYRPIFWLHKDGPNTLSSTIGKYARIGARDGWQVSYILILNNGKVRYAAGGEWSSCRDRDAPPLVLCDPLGPKTPADHHDVP